MKLPRRNFLHLAAGAAALPAVSRVARAQAYPTRPVRIVVGFPAGSGPDIIARRVAVAIAGRGPVQRAIRRAFAASDTAVLTSSSIYDWTYVRRRRDAASQCRSVSIHGRCGRCVNRSSATLRTIKHCVEKPSQKRAS
jgi:hypothetical protein